MSTISQQAITDSEIRGLSWKQPMAELMKHGKVETRSWATNYRGLVLICSSAIPFSDRELIALCGNEQYARILQLLGPKWFNSVKRGSAIAVGRLSSCYSLFLQPDRKDFEEQKKAAEDQTFIKYNPELFTHHYTDVTPIQPFPWRGQLGWKTLTPEEKAKIKIL
jgi:hypothetical protein